MRVLDGLIAVTADHGGEIGLAVWEEEITLATGAVVTDSTKDLPANAILLGAHARVTQAIVGSDATGVSIGDPTTVGRFGTALGLTLGSTKMGQVLMQGNTSTQAAGPTQAAAAKLRLTLTGGTPTNPTAGKVRVTLFYITIQGSVN